MTTVQSSIYLNGVTALVLLEGIVRAMCVDRLLCMYSIIAFCCIYKQLTYLNSFIHYNHRAEQEF